MTKFLNFLKIIILALPFALCFLLLSETKAQSLSLSIWPPLLEVMIQPGKSITQVYKISNFGETDLVLTSAVVPFAPADELGNIELGTRNPQPPNWLNWFSFQNADLQLGQKFVLRPDKEQEVVLKIKIPENAAEDDYYLTLLFNTLPNPTANGSAASAQAKIGSNILLTVSKTGEPRRQAKIEEFSLAGWRIIDSFTKPQFLIRLKNTGKVLFKPFGTITTTGWFGQKYTIDLLPENVLAGSIRQINCQKENLPPAVCQLSAGFLLGKYTARLEFGADQANGEYQTEIQFFALPIKLIFGVLLILLVLFIIKSKMPIDKY